MLYRLFLTTCCNAAMRVIILVWFQSVEKKDQEGICHLWQTKESKLPEQPPCCGLYLYNTLLHLFHAFTHEPAGSKTEETAELLFWNLEGKKSGLWLTGLFLVVMAAFVQIRTSCFSDNGWQKYLGKLGRAAWCGWCLSNPANRIRREDRRGRLAAVYNAGMDLKRSKGLQEALWRRWGSLGWSAGVYILPAWTYGLALQINIQRHLILPSVRWQIEGRVMWIKDGRDIEIKREAFIKMPLF